ncbi:MAG TPA: hypothetical protein VGN20_18590, partial [Mucilaginibacter sp.]
MKYFKFISFLAIVIFCFLIITPIQAQAQAIPQNISNINVNDLTDAQIRQLLQQAQGAGLSDSQIVQQAQSRGMSEDQAQLLTKRIADI